MSGRRDEVDRDDRLDGVGAAGLATIAERLDEWADTAELMGDHRRGTELRERARTTRLHAMGLLDATTDEPR